SYLLRSSVCLPPSSRLVPYTPLFRSEACGEPGAAARSRNEVGAQRGAQRRGAGRLEPQPGPCLGREVGIGQPVAGQRAAQVAQRSEEHTSELQSRENLVCRLLLEKKT